MPGPAPKPAHLRQRKNRTSTAAKLSPYTRKRAPSLPNEREWQTMTREWWKDVWHSPMAPEFIKSDIHGLFRLAVLVDRFWVDPTTNLASEIRQQQAEYGLTPIARRRLQWEIEKVEAVTKKRQPVVDVGGDPRNLLRMVK